MRSPGVRTSASLAQSQISSQVELLSSRRLQAHSVRVKHPLRALLHSIFTMWTLIMMDCTSVSTWKQVKGSALPLSDSLVRKKSTLPSSLFHSLLSIIESVTWWDNAFICWYFFSEFSKTQYLHLPCWWGDLGSDCWNHMFSLNSGFRWIVHSESNSGFIHEEPNLQHKLCHL